MFNTLLRSLSAAILLLLSSQSHAMQQRFYVAAQAAYSQFDITNRGAIDLDANPALTLLGGYRFNPRIALELAITQSDDIQSSSSDVNFELQQLRIGASMFGELNHHFDIFAKIQLSNNKLTLNDGPQLVLSSNDMGFYYEVGLLLNMTDMLSVNASIMHHTSTFDNEFDYMNNMAGMAFQFNF